jgi:Fe2+ or Zn2+ uptake regulation protein
MTKIRKAILKILSEDCCLISPAVMLQKLKSAGLNPDRSTIFRELSLLTQKTITNKIVIGDINYYELAEDHHHHLVCMGCDNIAKISLSAHLQQQEEQIKINNNFTVVNHALEFYGYCASCQDTNGDI